MNFLKKVNFFGKKGQKFSKKRSKHAKNSKNRPKYAKNTKV